VDVRTDVDFDVSTSAAASVYRGSPVTVSTVSTVCCADTATVSYYTVKLH